MANSLVAVVQRDDDRIMIMNQQENDMDCGLDVIGEARSVPQHKSSHPADDHVSCSRLPVDDDDSSRVRRKKRGYLVVGATAAILLSTAVLASVSVLSSDGLFATIHVYSTERLRRRSLHYDSKRNKNGGRPKHATSYAQRHQDSNYYAGYYTYNDDDETESVHRRRYTANVHTNLSDVWLCLLTAFAWMVWFVSSFISSKKAERAAKNCMSMDFMDERFYDSSALVVRGHVLSVSRQHQNDSYLPTYKAVIDYQVESEQTQDRIQIRKQFETQNPLEQGFANVELLVLPEEPTLSVLKEDFDQQYQQEQRVQQLEAERKNRGSTFDENDGESDDPLNYVLEGRICSQKYMRLSTAFAAILVLASLGGTVQVILLMDADQQWKGWISLGVGTALMLPAAVIANKVFAALSNRCEEPEKQGYIVQSMTATGTVVTLPTKQSKDEDFCGVSEACMQPSSIMDDLCDGGGGSGESRHQQRNKSYSYTEAASYVVPEMSGCYFVRYNPKVRDHHRSKHHHHRNGDHPDSTIMSTADDDYEVQSRRQESRAALPLGESRSSSIQNNNSSVMNSSSSVSSLSSRDAAENGGVVPNANDTSFWSSSLNNNRGADRSDASST